MGRERSSRPAAPTREIPSPRRCRQAAPRPGRLPWQFHVSCKTNLQVKKRTGGTTREGRLIGLPQYYANGKRGVQNICKAKENRHKENFHNYQRGCGFVSYI